MATHSADRLCGERPVWTKWTVGWICWKYLSDQVFPVPKYSEKGVPLEESEIIRNKEIDLCDHTTVVSQ